MSETPEDKTERDGMAADSGLTSKPVDVSGKPDPAIKPAPAKGSPKGSRPIRAKRLLAVVAGTDIDKTPKAKPTTGTRRKSGKNLLLGLTAKQEAFAEAVVSGLSLSAAYRQAYDAKGMSDEAVRVEASRLLIHPNVSLRVKSLNVEKEEQRRMLAVNRAERVLQRLEKLADTAATESVKVRANELLGKTAGLFTEQIEIEDKTERSVSEIEQSIKDKLARLGLTG